MSELCFCAWVYFVSLQARGRDDDVSSNLFCYLVSFCSLFFSLPFLPYCFPCFNLCNGGKKGNLCSRLHDDKTFPYCPQVTNWLYLQNIKGYRYALRRGVTPAISGCISTKLGDSKERFLACLDCVLLIYFKYIGYILVYFGGPKGLQLQF